MAQCKKGCDKEKSSTEMEPQAFSVKESPRGCNELLMNTEGRLRGSNPVAELRCDSPKVFEVPGVDSLCLNLLGTTKQ